MAMVSMSREDYLRAIYHLEEEHGVVKSTDVAAYLSVSKPSVTEMVQQLNGEGLVQYRPYAKLHFTSQGKKVAQRLTAKHRLIELFLKKILKINHNHIHDEAHRLEHAFSDESITKIRRLLGNPTVDPHGKPIPE